MVDERTKRRPDFSPAAVPIRLADGQEWWFPKPWLQVHPRFVDGKPAATIARTTYGPEFDEAVDLLRSAETNHDIIVATMVIGAFLLRRQYDLSDADLDELFVYRYGSDGLAEQSQAMIREIAGVALGTRGSMSFRVGNG